MTKYLHIANPDKFTLPLCKLLTSNQEFNNHKFLFISDQFDKNKFTSSSVSSLKSPIRKSLIRNLYVFHKQCKHSDVIIVHGASGIVFFRIFPWFTNKLAWVIYGYELSALHSNKQINQYKILRKAKVHLTHIEEDSRLANKLLGSCALFHYTPMYMSNTVDTISFKPVDLRGRLKILVGNSSCPTNDHRNILEKLKKYEDNIEYIICPLNYGDYPDYKNYIISEGFRLFGSKFKPLEEFLSINLYTELLKEIDIAVFNHSRQEAMGVTLTLLSLGKIVYVNSITTSFNSLTKRGFKIFDNNLLFKEGPSIIRDISENKILLERYYSIEILLGSLKNIGLNPF